MKKLKTTWTETLLAFAMVCSVWTEYRFLGVIGLSEIILLFIGFFGKYSDTVAFELLNEITDESFLKSWMNLWKRPVLFPTFLPCMIFI